MKHQGRTPPAPQTVRRGPGPRLRPAGPPSGPRRDGPLRTGPDLGQRPGRPDPPGLPLGRLRGDDPGGGRPGPGDRGGPPEGADRGQGARAGRARADRRRREDVAVPVPPGGRAGPAPAPYRDATRRGVPAAGPGPETKAGVGRVPGVDQGPDRADDAGAMDHDEPAEVVAVPSGWRGETGMVVTAAVEPREGPARWAGCRAFAEAASVGNSALSVELAER